MTAYMLMRFLEILL